MSTPKSETSMLPQSEDEPEQVDANDLYELLISGNEVPGGSYDHIRWKISAKGETSSDAMLLTSVHESMHHLLNNSTAYGLLLIITAHLARSNIVDQKDLIRLVDSCRNAHEVYATYNSILLTSSDASNRATIEDKYPDYMRYVRQAEFLLKGLENDHLHYSALSAIIEACFQDPSLFTALRRGDVFSALPKETPDERLVKLSTHLAGDALEIFAREFIRSHHDEEAARRFVDSKRFPEDTDDREFESYSDLQRSFHLHIYESIRKLNIIDMMEKDRHLHFLEVLIDHVRTAHPSIANSLPDTSGNASREYTPITHYESETVVYRDNPPKINLISFSDYPADAYDRLIGRAEELSYIYLTARITERFASQYRLRPEQKSWLDEHHPHFILTIPIPADSGETVTHVVLDSPYQLHALENYPMLCSVSMLLTSDRRWHPWGDTIIGICTQVIVFDLPPSEQIPRSFVDYHAVLYRTFDLATAGSEYSFVVLLALAEGNSLDMFLLPCSSVMAHLLANMLDTCGPKFRPMDHEKDVEQDVLWLIRASATRLLDESHFDFNALRTQYGKEGVENAQFHGT